MLRKDQTIQKLTKEMELLKADLEEKKKSDAALESLRHKYEQLESEKIDMVTETYFLLLEVFLLFL